MNPLNSILVEGNLVRDPQLTKTRAGSYVCAFSLAVNRSYRQNDEIKEFVSFFDVEVWGRLAENCTQYLFKGRAVRVSGHLQQDRWENTEGEKRNRVKIIGEHVEFLSGKRKAEAEAQNGDQRAEAEAQDGDQRAEAEAQDGDQKAEETSTISVLETQEEVSTI